MDDILARIAHIIDHEAFGGEGTLGQQVAQRIAPLLDELWLSGYKTCHDLYVEGRPIDRVNNERRQAVFEVMDMEDELEAQERRHEL